MTIWQPDFSFIFEADQGSIDDPFFHKVLDAFAQNLRDLCEVRSVEVIVATDEALSRRETLFIRNFFEDNSPKVKLRFHVSSKAGYWAKKSLAAQVAFGHTLVFLDSDCVPEPDWALAMAEAIDAGAEIVRAKTYGYSENQHQTLMTSIWQFPTHFASDPIANMTHSWGNNFAVSAEFFKANPVGMLVPDRPDSRIAGHHWDSVDHPLTDKKTYIDAYVSHVPYEELGKYLKRMRLHGREMQQVSVLAGAGIRTLVRKTKFTFAKGHTERLSAVAKELGIKPEETARYQKIVRKAHWAMKLGKIEGVILDRNVRYVPAPEDQLSRELLGLANNIAIQETAIRGLKIRGRVDIGKIAPKLSGLLSILRAKRLLSKIERSGCSADNRKVSEVGVSVVIPTKNRLAELCRALNSISAQVVLPNEVVIVNDGDAFDAFALERIRASLDGRTALKLVDGTGTGAAAARKLGCAEATQPVIAYLDDDNIMMLGWIAAVSRQFQEPDVQAIFGTQIRTDVALGILGRPFNLERLVKRNYIDTGTIAHRRSVGRWDPSVKKLNDWDFNLHLTLVEKVAYRYVPVLASLYFDDAPARISDNGAFYLDIEDEIRAKYGR
jgi:hypothetical protein